MTRDHSSNYIPQLTGIRAVAAYMVFLHHLAVSENILPATLHMKMLGELYIGVNLFFVLSGFLIYQRYYDSYQPTGSWWANYTRNRIARIYPMYFLVTCATLVKLKSSLPVWLLNLTFLSGFSKDFLFTGVRQGWTLTVEACFYLLAPLFFIIIKKHSFWLPLVMTYLVGAILTLAGHTVDYHGFFQPFKLVFFYTFFGRCFEFFAGMYLARYLAQQKDKPNKTREGQYITWFSFSAIGLAILVMSQLQSSPPFWFGVFHPLGAIISSFVLPILCCFLFFGLISEQTLLRKILASRLMVLLGKSSYVFYLIHLGILQKAVSRFIPTAGFTHHIIEFIVLNILAIMLFFCIENPANKFIRNLRPSNVAPVLSKWRSVDK